MQEAEFQTIPAETINGMTNPKKKKHSNGDCKRGRKCGVQDCDKDYQNC